MVTKILKNECRTK